MLVHKCEFTTFLVPCITECLKATEQIFCSHHVRRGIQLTANDEPLRLHPSSSMFLCSQCHRQLYPASRSGPRGRL